MLPDEMTWTNSFRSRYVRMLEAELAAIKKQHLEETERREKLHAQELERAIQEGNRGWAEADRLRQYLIPGLPARITETSDNSPHKEVEVITGTPWQREQRREMLRQEAEAKRQEAARKAQIFPTKQESTVPGENQNASSH